jgi:hypothetical protein
MTDMLLMTAFQIRDPVLVVVLVKADDLPFQYLELPLLVADVSGAREPAGDGPPPEDDGERDQPTNARRDHEREKYTVMASERCLHRCR